MLGNIPSPDPEPSFIRSHFAATPAPKRIATVEQEHRMVHVQNRLQLAGLRQIQYRRYLSLTSVIIELPVRKATRISLSFAIKKSPCSSSSAFPFYRTAAYARVSAVFLLSKADVCACVEAYINFRRRRSLQSCARRGQRSFSTCSLHWRPLSKVSVEDLNLPVSLAVLCRTFNVQRETHCVRMVNRLVSVELMSSKILLFNVSLSKRINELSCLTSYSLLINQCSFVNNHSRLYQMVCCVQYTMAMPDVISDQVLLLSWHCIM